ncbi:MAG: NDP-sugar synthase, partial [Saprospiraceae bacterium]
LTNFRPKALVEVNQMPLLEIAIRRLKYFGFEEIIINVHHFAEQIISFLEKNNHFDIRIEVSDERDQLLETGGGLKKAAWFFDDGKPFLLSNTDILSNIDLKAFFQQHLDTEAMVTLAVRRRETSRYLIFNERQQLHGWVNIKTGKMIASRHHQKQLQLMAFSGFHVINPELLELMPDQKAFSIIDTYLETAADNDIMAYPHDGDFWLDVGKKNALEEAEELAKQLPLL